MARRPALGVQILPQQESFGGGLGTAIGTGFSAGIGQGLQALAEQKAQQLKQRTVGTGYTELLTQLGLNPQIAQQLGPSLAAIPEKSADTVLQNVDQLMEMLQSPPGKQPVQNQEGAFLEHEGGPVEPPSGFNKIFTPRGEQRQQELLALKKEAQSEKKRENLYNQFRSQKKEVESYGTPSTKLFDVAQEALAIINEGNPQMGALGQALPRWAQNKDTQRLNQLFSEIVLLKDSALPGRNSKARLQLQELSKAQIWQQPEVAKKALNATINDNKLLRDMAEFQAMNEFQDNFATDIPENWQDLVRARRKDIIKALRETKDFPPAAANDGKLLQAPKSNQWYESINSRWTPIDEPSMEELEEL